MHTFLLGEDVEREGLKTPERSQGTMFLNKGYKQSAKEIFHQPDLNMREHKWLS
ncbi:MAG: hypothetical protein ACLSG8_00435 [Barnesiella sp.]